MRRFTCRRKWFYGVWHEFWRFVLMQQRVEKLSKTFIEYPPMQTGASFNVEAVKKQIIKAIQSQQGG